MLFAALAPAALADTAKVSAQSNFFSPKTVKIDVGDKVRWDNVEGTHTVTMSKGGQNLDKVISGHASVTSKKFKKAGKFKYLCSFHLDEGMKGKVVVED